MVCTVQNLVFALVVAGIGFESVYGIVWCGGASCLEMGVERLSLMIAGVSAFPSGERLVSEGAPTLVLIYCLALYLKARLKVREQGEDLLRWLGQREVDPSQASGIVVSILLAVLTSCCAPSAVGSDRIRLLVRICVQTSR